MSWWEETPRMEAIRSVSRAAAGACFFTGLVPFILLVPLNASMHTTQQIVYLLWAGRPWTAFFGVVLLFDLHDDLGRAPPQDEGPWMRQGAILGALFAFLNLPGWGFFTLLSPTGLNLLRFLALTALTGACAGAWVGWEAYRSRQTPLRRFPRLHLSSLIGLALAAGCVMALFMEHD